MKTVILTLVFLLSFSFSLIAQNDREIKAELKHVTVYPDRAQMNHESSFDLGSGKTTLKLKGLSPYIDAQSIQVKGTGEFTILSVNLQNNFLQNLEDSPEVKNIRSQIETLQAKVEDETVALKTLQQKEDFLIANKGVLVKETNFSIDQFKTMVDVYTSNVDQVNITVLKKSRQIKEYNKQIAALQQQIDEKLVKPQLPSGEIAVTVSSEKQVNGKLFFSYVVSNAGWYPSYDVRVDDINKPVMIFYKANVYQNTGVAWKDVQLSFSNATPWVAGNVPVLNPWFIDFYTPVNYTPITIRGMASGAMKGEAAPLMVQEMPERKSALKDVAAAPVMVGKKVGEMSVTFDVSVPYSIPSDGKAQIIEIQRTTTPADYKYITIPKLSQTAYLTGNITDWAKQSLLSGEATLYFENTFVGKSYLNVNQLTDTLVISLGTDNSILVKREKRKDFTTRKVIGSNKTETYSFLLTIRNNKPNPIKITVNDQIPVSSNSSIVVEATELSGGNLNAETGTVKWDIDLKPQEKRELILSYSVKYPKNQNIVLE
jgi:uncharacterized protein (TIGR02231 family)